MTRVTFWAAGMILAASQAFVLAQNAPPATRTLPAGEYAAIALDPAASGVSAVNAAADLLKADGPDQAIAYFNSVLDGTKNFAVQRMIRFQLVDLYRQAGRPDKALEVLKDLITLTPPTQPPSSQVIEIAPAAEATGTGGGNGNQ
jgi:tetratricopeptide (TPR) repeat protein